MKVFTIIMAIVTILLLFFVLVCGLWISAQGTDAAGAGFHRLLGIASVVSGMVTAILVLVQAAKKKKAQTSA
jgi:hypothetical protein